MILRTAPLAFAALFAVRAFNPVDSTLTSILAAMTVVAAAVLAGQRWAGGLFLIFPIALITTPAAADLSFSLTAIDSSRWRWHAIAILITAGLSVVSSIVVLADWTLQRRAIVGALAVGAVAGGGLIGLVRLLEPTDVFGTDLTAAERDALPAMAMVNYAYAPLDISVESGDTYTARLVNPSSLPHTITIDELGIDFRVPAGREAIIEIDADQLDAGPIEFYCSIGDHRQQGMIGQLAVR